MQFTIKKAAALLAGASTLTLIACSQDDREAAREAASDFTEGFSDGYRGEDKVVKVTDEKPATVEDAEVFIAKVEDWTRDFGEYSARVAWVQATYITHDTNWLVTRTDTESTEMGVKFANEAKRFNDIELPAEMRRKIEAIKLGLNIPAPERPGAAGELAEINTRMGAAYETGKIELNGEQVARSDLESMMGEVRNAEQLEEIWTKWRAVPVTEDTDGNSIKSDYAKMIALANEGARELGYDDVGAMWRSRYDMPPEDFAAEIDRLWGQVKPLYDELHCHVRAKLNTQYGDEIVPLDQPIRADLLGNMWAQSWLNLNDLVAPEGAAPAYDLTDLLVANDYDAEKIFRTGENFFSSLGFDPLPETFWERSMLTKPQDREVACHASAWDLDWADDIRVKMCTKINADDFRTVHHELGHNYYQRAYQDQSVLFQTGANGGFHEAIGDMISLSITPSYLKEIGLIDDVPDASKDMGLLMTEALEGVAFLPFGLLMDKWRWQAFSGELTPDTYNDGWWALREEYQGIRPPNDRSGEFFDPGGKYHIPANVSYERYFIARILQFQFHKAACDMAGWDGPLHRCSVYGSEEVGERFNAMLELGASQPWPDALQAFTGTRDMDGSAVIEYFAPLMAWLQEQNADRTCGW
ncbi:MAG: M2 family metallopeptidase [Pseudomonadota bacterium]